MSSGFFRFFENICRRAARPSPGMGIALGCHSDRAPASGGILALRWCEDPSARLRSLRMTWGEVRRSFGSLALAQDDMGGGAKIPPLAALAQDDMGCGELCFGRKQVNIIHVRRAAKGRLKVAAALAIMTEKPLKTKDISAFFAVVSREKQLTLRGITDIIIPIKLY